MTQLQLPKSLALKIPAMDSDAAQSNQLQRLTHEFAKHLTRRRGPLVALQWRRDADKFMKRNGTTYEQIRTKLEADFNLEVQLTYNELHQIISP